jgi:hypothetical protein
LTRTVAALCLNVLNKFYSEPKSPPHVPDLPPDPVRDLWQQLLQDPDRDTRDTAVMALIESLDKGELGGRTRDAILALAGLPPRT